MKKIISLFLVTILVFSLSVPALAANGSSREDAIVSTSDMFAPRVGSGKTLWYTYSNPALVDNGEFIQKVSVSCGSENSFSVTYGPVGSETVVNSVAVEGEENVFVNVNLTDYNSSGNYTFAITNKSNKSVKYTIVFESLPEYVFTGADLFLGSNEITYDSSAPTALYSFSSGDVQITDVDGNVIETKPGGGAGTYKFTVLNASGEAMENALIGNWGTIGYPVDLTGDLKTNTFVWNTEEDGASLLLGVSNVSENFVIKVERTGDYVSDQERIEFIDYVNVHTPGSFTLPAGEIVEFDINKTYNLVADNNGVYHLDSVNGPVVYVDMINDVVDLYGAYHNAYGATALRGIYTNDLGKTCGYEFYGALESYSEAMDTEGYYPMTVDLEMFIKTYGAAQGWFIKGYTPYDEIEEGGNPDSFWLIEAFYFVSDTTDSVPETTTPEVVAPEVTTPETTAPEAVSPETTTPEVVVPEVTTPETTVPEAVSPETTAPESVSPETTAPETEVVIEDVVIDPIVSDDSGLVKLPVLSKGDMASSIKLTYTFKFNTEMFEFNSVVGLEEGDYTVVATADGVVITVTNISKVAAIKSGNTIFEMVLAAKSGADVKELNLKVEYKNEKATTENTDNGGLGTAPEKAPETGDNMIFVVAVALVAIVGSAIVMRRREFN